MLPYYSTNRAQKSIKVQGAKLWNSLPFSLKQNNYHIVNLLKNTIDRHFEITTNSSSPLHY